MKFLRQFFIIYNLAYLPLLFFGCSRGTTGLGVASLNAQNRTERPANSRSTETELAIQSAGTGCDDDQCIWVVGTGFTDQVTVTTKSVTSVELNHYSTSELNLSLNTSPQVLTLRLKSAEEVASLSNGLSVDVQVQASVSAVAIPAPVLHLFLVMGQSNAVGARGDGALMGSHPSDSQTKFFYTEGLPGSRRCTASTASLGQLAAQVEPSPCLDASGNANYLFPYGSGFGPEIGASRSLAQLNIGRIGIFKFAWNGTGISDWDPTVATGPQLFPQFVAAYRQAMSQFSARGYQVKAEALFWMQGETDSASAARAAVYLKNFQNLIANVRSVASSAKLPVIAGLIAPNRPGNSWVYADQVRSALMTAADSWVETSDLPVDTDRSGDGVHYDSEGQLRLGSRFTQAYQDFKGGKSPPALSGYEMSCASGICSFQLDWQVGGLADSAVTVSSSMVSDAQLLGCSGAVGSETLPWIPSSGMPLIFHLYVLPTGVPCTLSALLNLKSIASISLVGDGS